MRMQNISEDKQFYRAPKCLSKKQEKPSEKEEIKSEVSLHRENEQSNQRMYVYVCPITWSRCMCLHGISWKKLQQTDRKEK